MKTFKYISIILNVFVNFNLVFGSDGMMNVGTTLFTVSDNSRVCWSVEQLSLLRARMIYQDVLPKTSCISMSNADFIIALINYFRMAVVKVKSMTSGRTTDINLMALTDTIGGYLRSIILPLSKMSYYEGNINYEIIGNLIQLYEEIKTYLHTDGKNWAPPQKFRSKREIRPLPQILENSPTSDPCEALVYSTDKDGIHIPMPFFDSKTKPSSIAVPFKTYPLRNLNSKCAVLILVRYYLTVLKCLESKHSNKNAVDKFNKDYEAFLDSQVVPLLKDEKIYPAFGSVYRIKESINKAILGVEKAYVAVEPSDEAMVEVSSEEDQRAAMILLICIITVVFLWMIITLIYCCLKRRRGKGFFIKKRTCSSTAPVKSQVSLKPRRVKRDDKKSSAPSTPKKKHTHVQQPPAKKVCPRCKKDNCDSANCNLSTFAKFFSAKADTAGTVKRCPNCPPISSNRKCKLCKRRACSKSSASILKISPSKSESQKIPSQKSSSPSRSSPRESLRLKQKQISERNKAKCKKQNEPKCCKSSPRSEAPLMRPEKKFRAQTHFMFNMASMFNKGPAKIVKSAPVSGKNASLYSEEKKTSCSSNTTTTTEEKPLVFGYDFETTTSESSSLEDSSANSSPRRLVKFDT